MTCREFTDFIADYLSAELPEHVQRTFERHLDVCVNCRRYLAQYRQTIACGRVAFDDRAAGVPEDVPEDLIAAILATRE
jgi:anti-sigma factor RsiW